MFGRRLLLILLTNRKLNLSQTATEMSNGYAHLATRQNKWLHTIYVISVHERHHFAQLRIKPKKKFMARFLNHTNRPTRTICFKTAVTKKKGSS